MTHGRRAKLGAATVGVCLVVVAMSAVATTTAFGKVPTGKYAVFAQCPRFTPGVTRCVYAQTTSGEVTIGKQTVPITNTITLQGGTTRNEETEAETFVGAINGETLSKSPENVPGGLSGLVNCTEITNGIVRAACALVFENGLTGVNATTELAKPASSIGINTNNLVNEEGAALTLPVKVKLENPLLGSECYIGSSSKPIVLPLTTGRTNPPLPNHPINGKSGFFTSEEEANFVEITQNTLVENAFSAPEATGCGGLFAFVLDPLIDSKLGLPSSAGHNTVIQNNTIRQGVAEAVIASEK
jgi:hypothetical protein